MEKKTKYTAALIVSLLALGCLIWAPQALARKSYSYAEEEVPEEVPENWPKLKWNRWWGLKNRLWWPMLRNATLGSLTGKAVALDGQILVVQANGDYVNVVVPKRWIVGKEVMDAGELFEEGGPLQYDKTLTISLLKYAVSGRDHSVTFLYAYKIKQGDTTASAVLPFNIQATP